MLQMTSQLTLSSHLGFEVHISSPLTKKKPTSTVSIEIHKSAIFDRLKIKSNFVLSQLLSKICTILTKYFLSF
jgi:hypothetical protein